MTPGEQSSAREALEYIASSGWIAYCDEEHILHELAHATLLNLSLAEERMSECIAERVGWMTTRAADWHEVLTCAAELRAAELLGLNGIDYTPTAVLGGNTVAMPERIAERRIAELVETETTYRRACRVVETIPAALELAKSWTRSRTRSM